MARIMLHGKSISGKGIDITEMTRAEYERDKEALDQANILIKITDEQMNQVDADDIVYDDLNTVKDKIDELIETDNTQNNAITQINNDLSEKHTIKIKEINLNVDVVANTSKNTTIPYDGISTNKVISTTVTWSNSISDTPTSIMYYHLPYSLITHKWSVTQTVKFSVRIAYFE